MDSYIMLKKSLSSSKKINLNLKKSSYLFNEFFETSEKYKTLDENDAALFWY